MSDSPSYHMTPEEFRAHGRAVVDWIAEYFESIDERPVSLPVAPGEIRAKLPSRPPESPEAFAAMLRDLDEIIMPGVVNWQSPNFFAYFPANASGPSVLGEFLSAGLGIIGMLWATSPSCTELETHVLDWLVDLLGLPAKFLSTSTGGGVIQDTASSASLCAMLAARDRATDFNTNTMGLAHGPRLIAYTSAHAHSSIEKAAVIAGIGRENLRLVPVDERFSMRAEALETQIRADRAAGFLPFFITATVGTTSSGGIDPVRALGEIASRHNCWLHVDAAMFGTAAICPEHQPSLHDGLELADSYCFNPHKWMFTSFDCDAFWVADRSVLVRTLSVLPEYLRTTATESGKVIDYRDWQIPLGRRFRALKLWFVLRHYGAEGIRHHIREHIHLATEFARWVSADEGFLLAAPPALNLVCLRHRAGDGATQAIMERVNQSGHALLSHTRLDGRYVIRVAIGQTRTEHRHVKALWTLLQECAAEVVLPASESDINRSA